MGKHHGKNSWRFMGAEFLPQTPWGRNTMGKHHGKHSWGFMGAEFLPQTPWGSKYHGKTPWENSWGFMGAEFLPQTPWGRNGKHSWGFMGAENTMGKIDGVSWVPNFYLKRHGIETPWEKFMAFHGCRISTSNAMGFFMGFPWEIFTRARYKVGLYYSLASATNHRLNIDASSYRCQKPPPFKIIYINSTPASTIGFIIRRS
jgi:hypothetical protein